MSDLRALLQREQERLEVALAPLREQSDILEAELRDVRRALHALQPTSERRAVRQVVSGQETIQDMIASTLADFPLGTTAKRLVQDISITFGREVSRESIAPQLSRMERAGELIHEGKVWRLATPTARAHVPNGSTPEQADQDNG